MWRWIFIGVITIYCNSVIGQQAGDFYNISTLKKISLADQRGDLVTLSADSLSIPTVLVFMSPECPLCKRYTKELREIRSVYADKIFVAGVISGNAYSPQEITNFSKEFNLNFPLYIDKGKELTQYLNATVTPEVVFIDPTGSTIYRGAIDNWVEELGRPRIKADKLYLENAINNFINNLPVLVKRSTPKGCLINEY